MGTWIFFAGIRAEWGYDWTNLVPPMNGNMHNLNLLAAFRHPVLSAAHFPGKPTGSKPEYCFFVL